MTIPMIHYAPNEREVAELLSMHLIDRATQLGRPLRLAVSGGSTPASLYCYWRDHPNLLYDHPIHFYWVDERLVPMDSPDSNYGNAYRMCFGPLAYPDTYLHPIVSDGREATAIAEAYDTAYPGVDIAILGMGDDGHTSSLFPGQEHELGSADYIASVHPTNGIERVALSYRGISHAGEVLFHILGDAKRCRLLQVMEQIGTDDSPIDDPDLLPAARAMRLATAPRVYTDISGL